jgi:hypothetical protein
MDEIYFVCNRKKINLYVSVQIPMTLQKEPRIPLVSFGVTTITFMFLKLPVYSPLNFTIIDVCNNRYLFVEQVRYLILCYP